MDLLPRKKLCDPHGVLESLLREFWGESAVITIRAVIHCRIELGRDEGDLAPSAGVIVLTAEADDEHAEPKGGSSSDPRLFNISIFLSVRLWCAFTTASMAIAYASTKNMKPKVSGGSHE
jgi:hypothetical protein